MIYKAGVSQPVTGHGRQQTVNFRSKDLYRSSAQATMVRYTVQ